MLIALPLTPAACLLRAWLPVGDVMGVERNNLNSIEWSEGYRSFSTTLYPFHPYSHKHPVSLCVMGWSQALDTLPAHCLPAWVEQGCVDTAGVGRGAEKSSDLTGVKAPLSLTHTHMITCAQTHGTHRYTMSSSSFFAGINFSSDKFYCLHCFSFAQECVYETPSDCLFFLPLWITLTFQHGHTFKSTSGLTFLVSIVDLIFVRAKNSSGRQIDHKGSQYPSHCWVFLMFCLNRRPVGGALYSE